MSDDNINAIRTFGSDLSVDDVKDLCAKYELPGHLEAQAPLSPVAITKATIGMVGIYQNFLEACLHFPLSPLLLELLSSFGVHITQLCLDAFPYIRYRGLVYVHALHTTSDACPRMTAALREQISMLVKHVVYSHNFPDVVLAAGGMSNNWPQRDFEPCFMEGDHGCVLSVFEAAVYTTLSSKPIAKSNTFDHYPPKKRCRSKMESERAKYEPGFHKALNLPNNSSCVVLPVEVQGYSAYVNTMGNMIFLSLAPEVSMGQGLSLMGLSDDLTIGIDDLLNQLEQFELGVPVFCEGSSITGRGAVIRGLVATVIIEFLDKFITVGKNKGEGLLRSSSVDVTTCKGLVDIFVQGVNLQRLYEDLLVQNNKLQEEITVMGRSQAEQRALCDELSHQNVVSKTAQAEFLSMVNSLKKDLEVSSKLCSEMTSVTRWRDLDLHTTQAVLEVKQHDLDFLLSRNKYMSDKYA
ncbi:hypothetical protein Tco_1421834 [Tanacetum coccineum]